MSLRLSPFRLSQNAIPKQIWRGKINHIDKLKNKSGSRVLKWIQYVRALQRLKHPRPWSVKFMEVSKENSIPRPLLERFNPAPIDLSYYMNVRIGDTVQVLYGPDKGRKGVVLTIDKKNNQVIVEGCNMKKVFASPFQGGPTLTTAEMPIHITNVSLIDPVIKKPTRVKRRYMMTGECVRISKLSGCAMPEPVEPEALEGALREQKLLEEHLRDRQLGPPVAPKYQTVEKRHYEMLSRLAKLSKFHGGTAMPPRNQLGSAVARLRAGDSDAGSSSKEPT
uniref:Large ribosomal subunit protein uL24c n=1 Tax=Chromera velia CCMP2878 TaxID=1169474 RepID=A0A0G4HDI3_9ALVE|mmetsp:Transcript_22136/g.43894  ORF Transcript_22136/g.43894 Transcript_22136/m.43894 type:complete len:279 (-) Transcript_22136:57-893(-)|eukprot:Cvel_6390.t1-p1 / transcript=Cvel_6390.t1 / gene=Cvel_6390 / organism=Chromera_velia_CCMP2878 / gene_product=50S ribosomal protein L24, putative / transcript_product=50S ribosomal protein L24, putative / location=Cvel_scaffold312:7325-11062(+) / protein_length=278 / sequence_SO=supercontig / SO=protein_coding / is_pseudo=false